MKRQTAQGSRLPLRVGARKEVAVPAGEVESAMLVPRELGNYLWTAAATNASSFGEGGEWRSAWCASLRGTSSVSKCWKCSFSAVGHMVHAGRLQDVANKPQSHARVMIISSQ